jgi:hypothetical protein
MLRVWCCSCPLLLQQVLNRSHYFESQVSWKSGHTLLLTAYMGSAVLLLELHAA